MKNTIRKISQSFNAVNEAELKQGFDFTNSPPNPLLIVYKHNMSSEPLYGFRIKAKPVENEITKLFKSESNRRGVQPNGTTFDQTQFDYNEKCE